ncbi:Phenylalanyl-tRNA synthetase beta chain [hydrothermal vent metagenome]|uniref:Phenylalanine--tRNA ligase beta subunit n=1 Tax=hydrothermal vent metagenome TaxID=652676 RepID=A0A1W1CI41_9ZZZZ
MIITRNWLNNFIDISKVSDEKLYETFNSIGLEVDSIKKYIIPEKVVVGEIISCGKHPNADKLRVCQIDIGGGSIRQIVCGASNVVYAKFVPVATIGTKLGDDFEIKHTTLRGVDSEGMVCSTAELGLPNMGSGIMILDDSIGKLVAGKELREYEKVNDTVIELELTANRGDCLSIYGVARDLSAALNIPINTLEYEYSDSRVKVGLARVLQLKASGKIQGSLRYTMAKIEDIHTSTLCGLRLAFIGELQDSNLANILKYATHTTGVILRAYKTRDILIHESDRITLTVSSENSITTIQANGKKISTLGVCQYDEAKADEQTTTALFEASYINPNILVDSIADKDIEKDELYYRTSRGSEPKLSNGIEFLTYMLEGYSGCDFFDGVISVEEESEAKIITVVHDEISQIIGEKIEKATILSILKALQFKIQNSTEDAFGVTVPKFRHDIENIQDIAEEIVRIIGINNIEAKPLKFLETDRTNRTINRHYAKKALRERAVASSFYETISYAFSDKSLLKKYGFPLVKEELDIINPITEDLNTLRTTILINMLNAVKRNISYSKKSIALFEIGTIFDENRNEKEVLSLIFSGQREGENVTNAGKPQLINFEIFTKKLSTIIGDFELRAGTEQNSIIHPYQSADIIIDNEVCGFISKLHPTVAEEFDLPTTFIAEISFDALMPKHINANPISKFQGVHKDLSLVIDKNLPYNQVATAIKQLELPLLRKYYPIDIYEDESLGDEKSLTVRLFIQSLERTMEDKDIENTVNTIINSLKEQYGATLR